MQLEVTWYKIQHTGKQNNKTPLGKVKNEKSHFSSYLCSILESGTFFCSLSLAYLLYYILLYLHGHFRVNSTDSFEAALTHSHKLTVRERYEVLKS